MGVIERARPQMAECEIEIISSILETQRPARVLEWGVGGSTVYWPGRYDFIERWVGIEGQPDYYDYYAGQVAEKVELRLARVNVEDYVQAVVKEGKEYDFVLVDGGFRVECLEAAPLILAARGVVVLHDSGRLDYRPGWKAFPKHEELYEGELPDPERGFKHRGVAVFWQDAYVKQAGWIRDYA